MSGLSSGAGPSDGVVRNSALSFVARAQVAHEDGLQAQAQDSKDLGQSSQSAERQVPEGLKALCDAYSRLYPDQNNPLQVTTRIKYWLGGQDPLDYISMYWNPGKPDENIPSHWHYVSFGLSDLHGDGRVHPLPAPQCPSGAGCELSFRLAWDPNSGTGGPPLWPAALLQALARYIFSTGNKFCAGDHISWHAALDGAPSSRVRHLLVANDPQLPDIRTPYGSVCFMQMVGCTGRELRAAQRGSGFAVLKHIADDPNCGGSWLVTRACRRVSARGVLSGNGGNSGGSDHRLPPPAELAGVSAAVTWEPLVFNKEECGVTTHLSPLVERQIKETLQRGLTAMSTDRSGPEGHTGMSTDSFEMSSIERALPQVNESVQSSWRGEDCLEALDGVHLILNPEGASLLPLAIGGRVCHGRHFTWRCGVRAVTVLCPTVHGAFATVTQPYVTKGNWLQILLPKELAQDMLKTVSELSTLAETDSETDGESERDRKPLKLPLSYSWPKYRLKISVLYDHEVLRVL